jgi:hypothetical protein
MASTTAWADTDISVADVPLTVSFSGFIRADYGNGDRYATSDGEDRLGISKSFLVASIGTEDIKAILDYGATILTDTDVNGGDNGSAGVKDAFIIVGVNNTTGFSFSVGAQPLLFGLRPNGYPGDSSLQPNLDYGIDGAFAVSQQAGPSIIGNYKFTPDESLRFGAFDLAESNAVSGFSTATSGSKLKDNLFILWRGNNIGNTGIYATAGAERLYVGVEGGPLGNTFAPLVDDSKTIYSAGIGYKQGIVDVSVEYIHLDSEIVYTQDDERYIRAHASVNPAPGWTAYVDYSNAHELGANTYRIGGSWQFRRHLALTVEYSKDEFSSSNGVYAGGYSPVLGTAPLFGIPAPSDIESVDARLTFTF